MPETRPSAPPLGALAAFALGALLAVCALALAEFVSFPATGHRVDTSKWPIEAQAILAEKPGTPLTPQQWKRIDSVLHAHGGLLHGQRPYWSQTVRASWWWFIVVPFGAAAVLRFSGRRPSFVSTGLLAMPSVVTLLAALLVAGSAA